MEGDSTDTCRSVGLGDSLTEETPVWGGPWLQLIDDAPAPGILQRIRRKVLQGALVLSTLFVLLWAATFIYGSFYYSFMPKASYSAPVHYYYRSDCESGTSPRCSYPMANVSLLRNGRNQVMSLGQKYRISLELKMPDSPTNQMLGMFMIRISCHSKEGGKLASSAHSVSHRPSVTSSRFAMLRYRSDLLRTFATMLFLPGFLSGAAEQAQTLEVELFSDYTEDPFFPAVEALVEILSGEVQIYSARLNIYADFTGLRYLLYHYPVMSAFVGVSSNLAFLSVLLLLSFVGRLFSGTKTTKPDAENEDMPESTENSVVRA